MDVAGMRLNLCEIVIALIEVTLIIVDRRMSDDFLTGVCDLLSR